MTAASQIKGATIMHRHANVALSTFFWALLPILLLSPVAADESGANLWKGIDGVVVSADSQVLRDAVELEFRRSHIQVFTAGKVPPNAHIVAISLGIKSINLTLSNTGRQTGICVLASVNASAYARVSGGGSGIVDIFSSSYIQSGPPDMNIIIESKPLFTNWATAMANQYLKDNAPPPASPAPAP